MLIASVTGDAREKLAADLRLVVSTVKRPIHDLLAKTGEDHVGSVTTRLLQHNAVMTRQKRRANGAARTFLSTP